MIVELWSEWGFFELKDLCEIAITVPILGSGDLKVMEAWQTGEEGTLPLGEQQTHLDREIKGDLRKERLM